MAYRSFKLLHQKFKIFIFINFYLALLNMSFKVIIVLVHKI